MHADYSQILQPITIIIIQFSNKTLQLREKSFSSLPKKIKRKKKKNREKTFQGYCSAARKKKVKVQKFTIVCRIRDIYYSC